jgi:hypothetical protein
MAAMKAMPAVPRKATALHGTSDCGRPQRAGANRSTASTKHSHAIGKGPPAQVTHAEARAPKVRSEHDHRRALRRGRAIGIDTRLRAPCLGEEVAQL